MHQCPLHRNGMGVIPQLICGTAATVVFCQNRDVTEWKKKTDNFPRQVGTSPFYPNRFN